MRLVEQHFRETGEMAAQPGSTVEESMLAARKDLGDCMVVIHRRYTTPALEQLALALGPGRAPFATREIVLAVPVGLERYALWQITFGDSVYDDYEHALERIFTTLALQ
jgi:hypothetical protein